MKFSQGHRTVWAVVLLLVLVVGMNGCQKTADVQSERNQAASFPITVTDDIGRQVILIAQPQRIVSLAPSNTEILYYLGLADQVVGDTTYCDYPAQAQTVNKVGGYMDPSLEKIVMLKPDLIVATDVHQPLLPSLEDAGLKVVVVKNPNNLAEVFASIQLIGRVAGVDKRAEEAAKSLQSRVEAVKQKISLVPEKERPTVYYEMWDNPFMSVGKDNLIAELIRYAGGINITEDSSEAYPQISAEIIIARSPMVMINSYGHDNKVVSVEEIKAREGWQGIAFVKNTRIYNIDADLMTLPGPRIVGGLEQLAADLYPQIFNQTN